MRYLTALVLSLPLVGAYAIFAIGIVLIYRASRVLNLAHGAMAMVPAYLLYALSKAGVPLVAGLPVALCAGAALGLAIERLFVRRLRGQGPTAQTVGTVAALSIMVAVTAKIWGTAALEGVRVFPQGGIRVGVSTIRMGEIGLFVVMLVVSGALFTLLQRTDLGLMMRGTAESRLAAALHGVNPDRITELTWALGGALAALAGILLAAITSLHPYRLTLQALPGFIAGLIGGLGSLPGALAGAAVVGATQGLVPVLGVIGKAQGAPQLFLTLLAMVVMARRGQALIAADVREASYETGGGKSTPPPQPGARAAARAEGGPGGAARATRGPLAPVRRWAPVVVVGLGVAAFPWTGAPYSVVGSANLAAEYALVAISLVLLTGWVGQISLGHAALVGVGAYATGWVAGGIGIPFPLSLPLAAAAAGAAAALLGVVALKVRGLYLAVATLVFSWMASEFLFRQGWFIRHDQIPDRLIGGKGWLPSFDFTDRRIFYLAAWAVVALVVYAAANLRDSKTGRAFFAVRGSEMAAASLGIDVMRTKLIAFATSGAIAGVAGNLFMSDARVVTADQFTFNVSLFFLAAAVVGGLTSLGGAVASALVFAGLTEVFFRVPSLGGLLEIVSGVLLATTLLAYRGGLASLPARAGRMRARIARALRVPASAGRLRTILARRIPIPEPVRARAARLTKRLKVFRPTAAGPASSNGHGEMSEPVVLFSPAGAPGVVPTGAREERTPLVEAEHVTVRFGGLTAVDDASLTVREHEIVGLIGPNGAGKTTLFNAVAGFNSPTSGAIKLYGDDVTALPVHRRAAVGVARTFQAIQLFGELTVYDNLLVATHVKNPTGFFRHLLVADRTLTAEQEARAKVDEVLGLLDLREVAERRTADLPFGVLRMVEVARALVTGFRVVMLDEPASGLDNVETDRLIEILRFVRGLGVTLLLIEHDVRMVTGVSDYIYVLDQGRIIAEGPPERIQRDPAVVAAYLGEPAKEEAAV